jgi:hypothetical protein
MATQAQTFEQLDHPTRGGAGIVKGEKWGVDDQMVNIIRLSKGMAVPGRLDVQKSRQYHRLDNEIRILEFATKDPGDSSILTTIRHTIPASPREGAKLRSSFHT